MQLKILDLDHLCSSFEGTFSERSIGSLVLPCKKKNSYTWDFWRDLRRGAKNIKLASYARAIDRRFLLFHLLCPAISLASWLMDKSTFAKKLVYRLPPGFIRNFVEIKTVPGTTKKSR
jgi:hypothetical protein